MFSGEDTFSLDTIGQDINMPVNKIDKISSILQLGLTFSPEGRAGLDELIQEFESIRIKNPVVYSAFSEANSLRAALLKLENARAMLFGENKSQNKNLLDQIYPLLDKSLTRVANTPAILKEYIYTLGVQAFHGATTTDEVRDRANKIIQKFVTRSDQVKKLHDHLSCKLALFLRSNQPDDKKYIAFLRNQLNQLHYILYKMESHHMGIDDLVKVNKHCKKRLSGITNALTILEKKQAFNEPTSQHKILSRLTLADPVNELAHKQNNVRLAIMNYLAKRNVSKRREDDITSILDQVDDPRNASVEELQKNLKKPLKKIDKSVWLFGRSELGTEVKKALTNPTLAVM
jgi:hypothetical protein